MDGAKYLNTLNGHYLVMNSDSSNIVHVNWNSRIEHGDFTVDNGIVHIVDKVIEAGPTTLPGLIAQTENLKIFSRLLQVTGWEDSLMLFKDLNYKLSIEEENSGEQYAKYKLYGYTAFVEPDNVFQKDWQVPMPQIDKEKGHITNWNEIMTVISNKCKEAYPKATAADMHSTNNAINQFVAYHLLPCISKYQDLIITQDFLTKSGTGKPITPDGNNFFQTMSNPYRLLRVTKRGEHFTGEIWLNRRSIYDNSYWGTYEEVKNLIQGIYVHKDNGEWPNYCPNGYYYPIDNILLYTDEVKNVVLDDRIRFSIKQIVPEIYNCVLSTNLYGRKTTNTEETFKFAYMKSSIFDNIYFGSPKKVQVCRNNYCWSHWETLSFYFPSDNNFTIPLLSVPYSGNWEIRMVPPLCGANNEGNMYTISIGTQPVSPGGMVPISVPTTIAMKKNFTKEDNLFDLTRDSISSLQYDKDLRLQNIMRGPIVIGTFDYTGSNALVPVPHWTYRGMRDYFRRLIVYRGHLEENTKYYIKVQALLGTKNSINPDFFELVPESVYDNPNKAEDIW